MITWSDILLIHLQFDNNDNNDNDYNSNSLEVQDDEDLEDH